MGERGKRTAAIVARLLGTEGYTDHVHNEVKRYWRKKVMRQDDSKRLRRLEQSLSRFMADADERDRLMLGRFIALRSRQSFDTGLRIGLMAFAHERDKTIFDADDAGGEKGRG